MFDNRPGNPTKRLENLDAALSDIKSGAGIAQREPTPIEMAWGRVEKEADILSDLINRLYGRLQPVLTPEGPSSPTSGAQGAASSPMAEGMFGLGTRLESSNGALRRLLDRLEL